MPNLFRVLQGGNGGSNSGGRSNNPNQAPAAARSRYTYPGQRGSLYASASDQTPEMIDPSEQNRSAPPQAMSSRMFDANPQTGRSHGSTPMMPREPPRTGSFANQNNPAIKTSSSDRVGLVPDLPIATVQRSTATASSGGSAKEIIVTVPPDIHPGMKFMVDVNGQWLVVTCPPTAGPNKKVKFIVPPFKQDDPEAAPMRAQPPQGGPPDRMPVTVDSNTRPGAYQVTRTSTGPAQVYRVTVPAGVRPGSEFTVHAGPRRVRVRCPPTSRPGQSLQITLPPEPTTHHVGLKMAPLTDPVGTGSGGAVTMSSEVQKVNQQAAESGGTAQTFLVTIPPNVFPGMQFTVNVNGQRFMVTCPPTAGPNQKVRIVPPVKQDEPEAAPKTQVFEVAVPAGVHPGQPFALVANGQRVLVTCPPNVEPGQKIRFQLPVSQVVGNIELDYESNKSGWKRTVRVTDLKFQWVRLEEDKEESTAAVDVNVMEHFDVERAFLEGNDARMRTGKLELVPASEACVDSRLVVHNHTLLSYADIASVQSESLEKKQDWFQKICTQLTSAWEDGHVKIVVRRKHLLLDSVDSVMSLGREDMRKRWRIEFLGEPAIDAGGLAREWFSEVTKKIFDPDFGLWLSSVNNQMSMNINPASELSCPDDHLIYFRFLGRVLGRALFDRQLVNGHMVRAIYKHLLGWPITFEDIQVQDEEYYMSLKKLTKMEDVSLMCLDFTVTEDVLGVHREVELVEGGAMKEVNNENIAQYLEANLRYRMLDRTKPQLTELLLGFFDIIPEPALTIFDANELELILCGLPEIDLDDWQRNTNYSGLFDGRGKSNEAVRWFWEIVQDDFDQEMRARLLQFVTGTSGVPSRGFSVLQGIDGNIKKFTIHGVDTSQYVYPRAHTCFNRIDLPNYQNKSDLLDRLKAAVTMCAVGFDME